MKPKEIQEKLGINADRIKFFKKQGVFTPENPPSGNRGTNYTETDYKNLQFLVVLTKMGMTVSDIRKMQDGECSLEEAIKERRKQITDEIAKKQNALSLLSELIEDKEEFETFHTERYWDIITERESKGEEFVDFEDLYGYQPVSLIRTVTCPYCGEELEVDLEDYETDVSSYDNENGIRFPAWTPAHCLSSVLWYGKCWAYAAIMSGSKITNTRESTSSRYLS